jgi:hypothetical protein
LDLLIQASLYDARKWKYRARYSALMIFGLIHDHFRSFFSIKHFPISESSIHSNGLSSANKTFSKILNNRASPVFVPISTVRFRPLKERIHRFWLECMRFQKRSQVTFPRNVKWKWCMRFNLRSRFDDRYQDGLLWCWIMLYFKCLFADHLHDNRQVWRIFSVDISKFNF